MAGAEGQSESGSGYEVVWYTKAGTPSMPHARQLDPNGVVDLLLRGDLSVDE